MQSRSSVAMSGANISGRSSGATRLPSCSARRFARSSSQAPVESSRLSALPSISMSWTSWKSSARIGPSSMAASPMTQAPPTSTRRRPRCRSVRYQAAGPRFCSSVALVIVARRLHERYGLRPERGGFLRLVRGGWN